MGKLYKHQPSKHHTIAWLKYDSCVYTRTIVAVSMYLSSYYNAKINSDYTII